MEESVYRFNGGRFSFLWQYGHMRYHGEKHGAHDDQNEV
jgi:hypothetical protein